MTRPPTIPIIGSIQFQPYRLPVRSRAHDNRRQQATTGDNFGNRVQGRSHCSQSAQVGLHGAGNVAHGKFVFRPDVQQGTLDPQGAHQPLHRAAGSIFAVPPQNVPNLARTPNFARAPNLARAVEFAVVRRGPVELESPSILRLRAASNLPGAMPAQDCARWRAGHNKWKWQTAVPCRPARPRGLLGFPQ